METRLYQYPVYTVPCVQTSDLWSQEYSPFYRTVMSRNLLMTWTRVLRFDNNPSTRPQRVSVNTFVALLDLWNAWNHNLQQHFRPTECITINEQLISSRNRSPHRIYNPSKPRPKKMINRKVKYNSSTIPQSLESISTTKVQRIYRYC